MTVGPDNRRHPRFSYATGAIVTLGGKQHECSVQDISASGAGFKSTWRPVKGAIVAISFSGTRPVKGQVVRHTDEGFAVTSVWDLKSINSR
jgi:hypothetical protein